MRSLWLWPCMPTRRTEPTSLQTVELFGIPQIMDQIGANSPPLWIQILSVYLCLISTPSSQIGLSGLEVLTAHPQHRQTAIPKLSILENTVRIGKTLTHMFECARGEETRNSRSTIEPSSANHTRRRQARSAVRTSVTFSLFPAQTSTPRKKFSSSQSSVLLHSSNIW